MFDKNPYENESGIPDFVEKKDDPDMSVFKMSTSEIGTIDENDDEYDEDDRPRRKLNYKGVVVLGAVLIVILLITTIISFASGVSKGNKLTKLQTEYTALEQKYNDANTQLTKLQNDNVLLSAELEKMKTEKTENEKNTGTSDSGTGTKTDDNTKYKVKADVAVRKGAGTSNDYANYDKLPSQIQEVVISNGDEVRTKDGAVVPVYETKNDSASNTWGRIADNAWVCLTYQGEAWGTKQ